MNFESLVEPCLQQIWQVSALIVVVGILAPFAGRRRPHFAYLLWLLVFLKCITPPLMSSPASVFSWLQQTQATASVNDETWHELTPIVDDAMPAATEITPQLLEIAEVTSPVIQSTPIHWQTIAFFAWLSGAALFGGYLLVQWTRMTRIIRRNSSLPNDVQNERVAEVFAATAKSLGVSRPPTLVVVSEPMGPAAMGCLRPTIVVPAELTNLATDAELESIFTHELTHIRRGDVGVAWLQAVASCVWWFHPLVWYANRQIVRWREAAVDEEVIAQLSISPRKYADALLCVMESRVRPFPAMQVGMAVGESTQTRLVRLMKQTNPCRRTPIWCWAAAILLGLAVLPGGAFSVAQQADFTVVAEDEDAANADVTLEVTGNIQVVANDSNGPADDPVLREELAISIQTPDKQSSQIAEMKIAHMKDGKQLSLLTTASVDGTFLTPKKQLMFDRSNPGRQRLVVMGRSKDGDVAWKEWHVMGQNSIQIHEGNPSDSFVVAGNAQLVTHGEREPLRADVRFAKEHVNIMGNVSDDAGNPVANANVALTTFSSGRSESFPSPSPNDTPNTVYGSVMSPPIQLPKSMQLTTKTDANGNWSLGKIAKGLGVTVNVATPNKPDVLTKIVASSAKTEITLPQSRDASVTVVDKTTGKPVGNVSVRATVQLGQAGTARVIGQTNEQGQVQLNLPLGKNNFVMKPSDMGTATHFPSSGQSTVDSATGSLSLKMDAATQIEFLVFDEGTGKPLPFLNAKPTQDSGIDHRIDNSRLKQGITLVTCTSGKAKFHIPGLAYRGYELLNPIEKPMELPPGQSIKYTFRVSKMKEYRLPVDDNDSTHLFSAAHQAAVKRLRALGAHVTTRGNPKQGHCSVILTQFWKGTAKDLSVIGDLQHLQQLDSLAYPVPKEFRSTEKPQAPIITDEYLKQFGKAKEVPYIHIKRDNFTDKGIAHLAGCKKLQNLWLNETTLRGEGVQSLGDLPLSSLSLHGPNLDFTNVDLSNLKVLNQFTLKNTSGVAVIPPKKVGRGVVHVNINPANEETLDRLNEYENLQFVLIGGETVNDDLLKHPLLRQIRYLQITKDCKITNEGLANLADDDSKLQTLTIEGEQFTDDAVPHLAKLSGLKDLQLQDVSITAAGLKKLKTALPELNLRTMSSPNYQYQVVPD